MKRFNYRANNFEMNVFENKNDLTFNISKKTIPDNVVCFKDLQILIARYLSFFPKIAIYKNGHKDAYFSQISMDLSDLEYCPGRNGEYGGYSLKPSKQFNLSFDLSVKIKNGDITFSNLKHSEF